MDSYSCYAGIDEKYYVIFEELWDTYHTQLPEIDAVLQDNVSVKATIFNLWVNYYAIDGIIFFKSEGIILNSNVSSLVNKLQKYLPYEIIEELNHQKHSEVFTFLYVYHMAKYLYQNLADFVDTHEFLKNHTIKRPCIHLMKDDDFEQHDIIYVILKVLNFEFIQMYLSQNKCYEMHLMALYFTKSFVNQHAIHDMNFEIMTK